MNTNPQSVEPKKRSLYLFSRSTLLSLAIAAFCISLFFLSSCQNQNQRPENISLGNTETPANLPLKVTQIDTAGLRDLLKPKGKPLLINFWATWCGPCREEFPALVRIGSDYKGEVDLITVSLDELSEIDSEVTAFLTQMRSDSPAYLLKTPDESAAIGLVSSDWQGALPFTILFSSQGEAVYSKQGKFDTDVLVTKIENLLKLK